MTTEGVDFSSSRPGGAALVAAGKAFVVRYVPYGGYAKGLTAAEITDYQAHGLEIALVFESSANRALAGQAAGAADARTAQYAADKLGFPATSAIYFGVDFDATDAQLPAIDAYLAGAAMILGHDRVGVYAGRRVISHRRTTTRWLWQTYAWSYGTIVPGIHLYQYRNGVTLNGASVDLDRSMQADFGQWAPLSGGGNVPGDIMGLSLSLPAVPVQGTITVALGQTVYKVADASAVVLTVAASPRPAYAVDHPGHEPGYLLDITAAGVTEAYFVRAIDSTFTPAPGFTQSDVDAATLVGARGEWDHEFGSATKSGAAKITPAPRP